MQQLYISKQQHGSKYITRYNIHKANIACKSSIHHLFGSYITYKHHKITTSHLNHHITSLQIVNNIIKSLRTTQGSSLMVLCDNRSQQCTVLGSDLTRYGEWESSPRE